MSRIPTMLAALALALTSAAAAGCAAPAAPPPAPPPVPPPPAPATPLVVPTPAVPANRYPSDVIDLTNWYLTLPTGRADDPDDVYPPALTGYAGDWFRLNETRNGVVFTANAGGVTTSGSSYPRSELREMIGGELAEWSNETGSHVLDVRQAVMQLPEAKPDVVSAQIHDDEDDVVEIRLEGEHLVAEYDDGDAEATLDPAYVLGTPFDLRITAADRRVRISYNGEEKADLPLSGSGWYFKAGSYVQSNPSRGERADAVGTVVIYALRATHTR
jgi:hypothetical protein